MALPAKYSWLSREGHPSILVQALKLYGTIEIPGRPSNPEIMSWAEEIGEKNLSMKYSDDSVPWCGLFIAVCALRSGLKLPAVPVRALSWSTWGTVIDKKEARLGDVLTFTRKGGGHVGIYVGEDDKAFHVLGGNQKDQVRIDRIDKGRLYSVNRTEWKYGQPKNVRKIWLSEDGDLSQNEA